MDVLRSVTLSTVAKNLGTKVSDFSADLIEDIGIEATLSDSLGNILGKTLTKVGAGQDLEFALASNIFSELKDPLKGVASDITELFAGANADTSQVEQLLGNVIDSVEGARNLNEAAIGAISSDLSNLIKNTSVNVLGEGFGNQFATALQAGLTAAVRNPDNPNAAEQAYYGSLEASSVAEISKMVEQPVGKLVDGVLGELGIIEKEDGTLVAPNNVIIDKEGNAVKDKEGNVKTWSGHTGFKTLTNGENIWIFDDGSSISTGFLNNPDFVDAGIDLGSYNSAGHFMADVQSKLYDAKGPGGASTIKLEEILQGVKVNAATDTRTFANPYDDAEITQTTLANPDPNSIYENIFGTGSVQNIPIGPESFAPYEPKVDYGSLQGLDEYRGGVNKIGDKIDDNTINQIITKIEQNPALIESFIVDPGSKFFDGTGAVFNSFMNDTEKNIKELKDYVAKNNNLPSWMVQKDDLLTIKQVMNLDGYTGSDNQLDTLELFC